jgi:hypothetical protein
MLIPPNRLRYVKISSGGRDLPMTHYLLQARDIATIFSENAGWGMSRENVQPTTFLDPSQCFVGHKKAIEIFPVPSLPIVCVE